MTHLEKLVDNLIEHTDRIVPKLSVAQLTQMYTQMRAICEDPNKCAEYGISYGHPEIDRVQTAAMVEAITDRTVPPSNIYGSSTANSHTRL
ncbi:hypothetical protein HOI26_05255 [Candidatus Woesearchaeota archaeon]|jgi:hypothetical protein|nr:hypothetical protein [Candidatus Woesearchaeota archaeon]MBT5740474.1 hypothetical protein [Candidatus Woesearchaeota archaeon]